jgi:predicted transglutaminase-like cysteine proteinase
MLMSLLVSCGVKKPAPPPVVEDPATLRIKSWQALIADNLSLPESEKLVLVNRFFNRLDFVDDLIVWGKKDYWATPTEMLRKNAGDCEDFTIAKYVTLRRLAVPDERLRLIYVKSLEMQQPHMVLGYYQNPFTEPLLLDSLRPQIMRASQRPDLIPIYSFNGDGMWIAKKHGDGQRVGNADDRLSLWRELRQRLQSEAYAATP